MTEAEREALLGSGVTVQGTVMGSESSEEDRRMSQVRVYVDFKDGHPVEFSEEGGSRALPELRRTGRPGEGIPGPRPALRLLPPAGAGDAAALAAGRPRRAAWGGLWALARHCPGNEHVGAPAVAGSSSGGRRLRGHHGRRLGGNSL